MAWHNMGEFRGLKEKLSGQLGDIADSLKTLVTQQTELIQEGLKRKQTGKSGK